MNLITYLIEAHIFRIVANHLEFLLLKRADKEIYPGLWQMVTGTIDGEERAYQTAIREIKEETGLTPQKFWVVPNVNSFYSEKLDQICMIPVFAALVAKTNEVTISEEHSEFRWVNKDEAISMLAWPGQRTSVEIINDYFMNHPHFLKFVEISL